jgi:hypothetical protein
MYIRPIAPNKNTRSDTGQAPTWIEVVSEARAAAQPHVEDNIDPSILDHMRLGCSKEREFGEPMKRGQQAGATTMVVNEKAKLYVGDANSARCANWSFISRVTPSFEALLAHL